MPLTSIGDWRVVRGAILAAALVLAPAARAAVDTSACSRSNGCGPDGWKNKAIADKVEWGAVDFGPACDAHDRCYGTWGESQATCDDRFHTALKAACRKTYPTRGFWQLDCYGFAHSYYLGVDTLGEDAFRAAKACVHEAMHREDRRLLEVLGGVDDRFRAMRGLVQVEATKLAVAEGDRLAQQVEDELGAAQEAVNEVSLFLLLLQGATPADGNRAALDTKVAQLRDLQRQLKDLNDRAKPGVEQQQRQFDRAAFESQATRLSAQVAPAHVELAADAVKAARDYQAAIHDKKNPGMGMPTGPTPAELKTWQGKILSAANLTNYLYAHARKGILEGCRTQLQPLRSAQLALRLLLNEMRPLHARAKALVAPAAPPRPPPPPARPPPPLPPPPR